jgi:uncharacterized protein DUF6960
VDSYINTWGMYPWIPSRGESLIHPDDRSANLWEKLFGKLLYCSGITDDGYLLLNDAHQTYRVKPDIYKVFPTPMFNYGDTVKDREKPERIGTIRNIEWHDKYGKEYYNLTIAGRKSTKRYFADELEFVTTSN